MTIPAMFKSVVKKNPEINCQLTREGEHNSFKAITYQQLYDKVEKLSWNFSRLGVNEGDKIGLICDNRKEWLALDLALLSLGAADVPRGCDSMAGELLYILDFSGCPMAVLENIQQLNKILPYHKELPYLKKVVLIDMPADTPEIPWELYSYEDLLTRESDNLPENYLDKLIDESKGEDLATLIYTSGTTGEPKGVMLTHENFMHQVRNIFSQANLEPGDIWLSVLPVWHSFERVLQYIALGAANTIAYSKPIGKIMLMDLQTLNPQWMASVPRIWSAIESGVARNIKAKGPVTWGLFSFFLAVASAHQAMENRLLGQVADFRKKFTLPLYILYPLPWLILKPLRMLGNVIVFKKIQAKVGTGFKAGISGGGALPPRLYKFFKAIGIQILEGYGLTETAPVVAFSPQHHPVMGVVGRPWPGTEIKIVNEEGKTLPANKKGVVMLKGPQVMRGYYEKPELTKAVLSDDGWLNSGDLGIMTIKGELKIVGRAKDTIVLLGGENIEPVPMEQKLAESPYIEQAVVVGQDQKYLAALLIPDYDALEAYAKENNLAYENRIHLKDVHAILELITSEISRLISDKTGFRSYERIYQFHLLRKSFEVGKELSGKQDIKRHVIYEMYKKEIDSLFK
jgi:long-chain acyl-CoA synthetase